MWDEVKVNPIESEMQRHNMQICSYETKPKRKPAHAIGYML